ncbi:phosphopantetheine-binding protein [Nocardia wallacei]|uniref:phosphopantetheine-binding protein n=1 Tax=Nocardia wallacei TaxID=480035 RepID=UPI0024588F63|nr:phosphopantetheine-binding protein [Nocardia wallacei]
MTTPDITPTLRAILADVTDLENPRDIGSGDDLFMLGMTSLETLRVLLQLEDRFHVRIPDELLDRELFRTLGNVRDAVAPLLGTGAGDAR